MFFGTQANLRGMNMADAIEEARRLSVVANMMSDVEKFNEVCVDFLVNNHGSAPVAGLAQSLLKTMGIPETQKEIETMLKVLVQLGCGEIKGVPFQVQGGHAILNNIFSHSTTTVTLMYGDQALQEGVTDVNGAAIGDAEKRSIRNALKILRHNPRLRHEMIVSWMSNAEYDENTHHKVYPKGGIDLFVALCLGDFTGNPEKDKDTWFAKQWELGQHLGNDANKLVVVNDYLGFATGTWKAFNERYGRAGTSFLKNGEAIINSRPHMLVKILGALMPKLFASVSPFKPAPVIEPAPTAKPEPAEQPAQGMTAGIPASIMSAVTDALKHSGIPGLLIGMIDIDPTDSVEASDEQFTASEIEEKELLRRNAFAAERTYREMTNAALRDVLSFIETNGDEYLEGAKEVLKQMKAMGASEAASKVSPEQLVEFIKYGNPRSIHQSERDAFTLASHMAAAVRFAYL